MSEGEGWTLVTRRGRRTPAFPDFPDTKGVSGKSPVCEPADTQPLAFEIPDRLPWDEKRLPVIQAYYDRRHDGSPDFYYRILYDFIWHFDLTIDFLRSCETVFRYLYDHSERGLPWLEQVHDPKAIEYIWEVFGEGERRRRQEADRQCL